MTLMSESKEKRTAQPAGVSHMKVFMQDFVLDIVRSFLQGDEVPLSWKLFLDSVVSTSTRPRIPVVNTQSPLHRRGRRKYLLDAISQRRGSINSFKSVTEVCRNSVNVYNVLGQNFFRGHLTPHGKLIRARLVMVLEA